MRENIRERVKSEEMNSFLAHPGLKVWLHLLFQHLFSENFRLLLEALLKELEETHLECHGVIVYHHGNNSYKLRCNHPDVIDVSTSLNRYSSSFCLLKNRKWFHGMFHKILDA